jgi:hypothetical protein
MNLVLFLLQILFASYTPAASTNGYTNNGESTTINEPGGGRGKDDTFGNKEYIICDDVNP